MSIKDTLKRIQAEEERRAALFQAAQLRKFLATALCAACGEPLGTDEEIIQSDDETKTLHKRCEETIDEPI